MSKEIDDLVERWHSDMEDTRLLHEYLGMSREEYAEWMRGSSLPASAPAVYGKNPE